MALPHHRIREHAVYAGLDTTIMHAELTLGGGMIRRGSVNNQAPNRKLTLPSELGGAQTRGVSLIVEDADEAYARATAAGAVSVEVVENKPFGGWGFACLGPEGQVWHIGTYDTWAMK